MTGSDGRGDPGTWPQAPGGQAPRVQQPASPARLTQPHSPLYHAQPAPRYERQQLIRDYQAAHGCRLVVMIGPIFGYSLE